MLVRSLEERRLTERRIGIEEKAVYLTIATWRRLSDALPGMRTAADSWNAVAPPSLHGNTLVAGRGGVAAARPRKAERDGGG